MTGVSGRRLPAAIRGSSARRGTPSRAPGAYRVRRPIPVLTITQATVGPLDLFPGLFATDVGTDGSVTDTAYVSDQLLTSLEFIVDVIAPGSFTLTLQSWDGIGAPTDIVSYSEADTFPLTNTDPTVLAAAQTALGTLSADPFAAAINKSQLALFIGPGSGAPGAFNVDVIAS